MFGLFLISMLLAEAPHEGALNGVNFPASAGVYEQGAVITVSMHTLESLQDEQLQALLQFTGSCGRVVLVDISDSIEEIFHSEAACDGQYLRFVDSTDNLQASILKLENLPEPARATAAQLNTLLEASSTGALNIRHLVFFWSSFLLLTLFLILNHRTRLIGIAFSAAASLLVPLIWPPNAAHTMVAWAESEADDRIAAYFALERDTSFVSGKFTSSTKTDRGSFDLSPALGFAFHNNAIRICNFGSSIAMTTHVYWRKKIFAMPAIESGSDWIISDEAIVDDSELAAPELNLFAQRSQQHELTLLRTLPVAEVEGQGWLLQYVTPDQENRSCNH